MMVDVMLRYSYHGINKVFVSDNGNGYSYHGINNANDKDTLKVSQTLFYN